MNIKRQKNFRRIHFHTKNVDIYISIRGSGGEDLEASSLGKQMKTLLDLPPSANYTSAEIYNVYFETKINPWRRWSLVTQKQSTWAKDIANGFQEAFEWQIIWEKLQKKGLVPERY